MDFNGTHNGKDLLTNRKEPRAEWKNLKGLVLSSMEHGVKKKKKKRKKKKWIFIIRKQNQLFGNSYSNFSFQIIPKNSGRLAAMCTSRHNGLYASIQLSNRAMTWRLVARQIICRPWMTQLDTIYCTCLHSDPFSAYSTKWIHFSSSAWATASPKPDPMFLANGQKCSNFRHFLAAFALE